jgi:hypothetical protein
MNTKMSVRTMRVLALGVAGWMWVGWVGAAETATVPPAAKSTHLSYGANEVLKLSRAKVGDETIVAYIKQASSSYDLNAEDIVYLRGEGVTDRVVSAMLTVKPDVAAAPAPVPAAATPPTPASAVAQAPAPGQTSYPGGATQAATTTTTVVQPAVTYVQPSPTVVYTSPVVTEYYGGPYYYGYPYYYGWRPGISVSLGFGGRFHGGGWHVGVPVYRGGFHHR